MSQLDELEKLNTLKEKGVLTEAEFKAQKKALLAATTAPAATEMVGITEAYASYWKKSFVWSGRATRAEYWWPALVNLLIGIAVAFLPDIFGIPYLIFSIAVIFPGMAVYVRRFHDVNKSAWVAFIPFWLFLVSVAFAVIGAVIDYVTITSGGTLSETTVLANNVRSMFFIVMGVAMIISFVAMLVFTLLPGTKGPNKYGEPR